MRTMTERAPSVTPGTRPAFWARVKTFFYESWLELKRVIWPSREDVTKMTGLVVAVVLVMGFFMYLVDNILARFTVHLFGR